MRIRILDPHWKKNGCGFRLFSLNLLTFFLTKQNFQIFCLIFSLICMLKLDEPFRNQEIFIMSLFSIFQIWGLRVFFLLIFIPFDPDPWICIFLRIRIQEAKILRIQRVRHQWIRFRILSTGLKGFIKWDKFSLVSYWRRRRERGGVIRVKRDSLS